MRIRVAVTTALITLALVAFGLAGPARPGGLGRAAAPGPSVASAAERSFVDQPSTLDDYRARIRRAYEAVRRTGADAVHSQKTAEETAFLVDELLPPVEVVDVDGREVTVDNSVLRSLVERLNASPTPDMRQQAVAQMRDHLASLLAAVGTRPETPIAQDPVALRRLLARQAAGQDPALGRRLGEVVDRVLRWIGSLWGDVTATPGGRILAEVLRWTVTLAFVGLLLLVAWRVIRRIRSALAAADSAVPGDAGPSVGNDLEEPLPVDALAFADGLAGAGRFRDAVRALMRGSVRSLRHAGLLRRTRARTTSELLGQLAGAEGAVKMPMGSLSARFERAWYGQSDPGPEGFGGARRDYVDLAGALAGLERAGEEGDTGAEEAAGGRGGPRRPPVVAAVGRDHVEDDPPEDDPPGDEPPEEAQGTTPGLAADPGPGGGSS